MPQGFFRQISEKESCSQWVWGYQSEGLEVHLPHVLSVAPYASRSTIGNLEAAEPGHQPEEELAQEQQMHAAPSPPIPAQQPRASSSSRRHRSRSPNMMERLTPRNLTKAQISFLQVLDDLETSQERTLPYAVPPQPFERHWEARPSFVAHQPYGSMGGPSLEQNPRCQGL